MKNAPGEDVWMSWLSRSLEKTNQFIWSVDLWPVEPAMQAVCLLIIVIGAALGDWIGIAVVLVGVFLYRHAFDARIERKISQAYSSGIVNGVAMVVDGGSSQVTVKFEADEDVPGHIKRAIDIRRVPRRDDESVARAAFFTSELSALIQRIKADGAAAGEIAAAARDIQIRAERLRALSEA